MRGLVVFPYMQINFDVARDLSVNAISDASSNNSYVFLVPQKDAGNMNPKFDDLFRIGTIAQIKQIMQLPGNGTRVIAKGISKRCCKWLLSG